MRFTLEESRVGLRNSTTRLPFRYGAATLSRCPQAIVEVAIEADGRPVLGWSGDCLPPGWFDKSPGKSYRRQIAEMLAAVDLARGAFRDATAGGGGASLFDAWRAADRDVKAEARDRGLAPLLASFGVSLVERAVMDALARSAGVGFSEAVRSGLYRIDAGAVHPELAGASPADWLPEGPPRSIAVRHTVGMADPLTTAQLDPGDRVDDGLPQTLDDYVAAQGLRFFKIKLSADFERDRDRLIRVAEVVEALRGADYRATLDGNEQFDHVDALLDGFDRLRAEPRLRTLLDNTLAIEQPLARALALDPDRTRGLDRLSAWRPVIIDESDDEPDSYRRALGLGYRGVSSKNCKGATKALLNAGLTRRRNAGGDGSNFLMTGEDLCCVGVVPVQSDLCLVATLGLSHAERNGHHYHPGLSYLPESSRRAALAAHPDFYADRDGLVVPSVRDGRFAIASLLDCPGFGFAALPEMDAYEPADSWRFESLGLDD